MQLKATAMLFHTKNGPAERFTGWQTLLSDAGLKSTFDHVSGQPHSIGGRGSL